MDSDLELLIHHKVVNIYMTELSITWEQSWVHLLQYNQDGDGYYNRLLFGYIKKLEINIPFNNRNHLLDLTKLVFRHCKRVESLKITGETLGNENYEDHLQIEKFGNLLPKLQSLHVELDCISYALKTAGEWLKAIFSSRQTKLNGIHLGNLSYTFLEDNEQIANLIFSSWSPETTSSICLATPKCGCRVTKHGGKQILPASPRIWENKRALKCRHLSLRNMNLRHIGENATTILNIGSRLLSLDFRNCQVVTSEMAIELEQIAINCVNIYELDIALDHPKCKSSKDSNENLILAITKFKALKKLTLSSYMLGNAKYDKIKNPAIEMDEEISENAMKNTLMWKLTQLCTNLESLKIKDDKLNRVSSENAMACISKLTNLKELNLQMVRTTGRGDFLSLILSNCKKLKALYLKFDETWKNSIFLASLFQALKHGMSIRHLHIKQQLKLSDDLFNGLACCKSLENIYLNYVQVNPELYERFMLTLTTLPKLDDVLIVAQDCFVKFYKNMTTKSAERVKALKPTYVHKTVSVKDDFLIGLCEKLWWNRVLSKPLNTSVWQLISN